MALEQYVEFFRLPPEAISTYEWISICQVRSARARREQYQAYEQAEKAKRNQQ
jgi:hypothetical protein